jgi:hypothetical protein
LLRPVSKVWQLGDIGRNPSSLVLREQLAAERLSRRD